MPSLLSRAIDTVWAEHNRQEVIRKKNGGRTPSRHRDAPNALLSRAQTIATLRAYMASAWLHQHQKPSAIEVLADQVVSEPRWASILTTIQSTIDNLGARTDGQFSWIMMADQAPRPDQRVLYYFSAIGTHVGEYRGLDEYRGLEMFADLSGDMTGGGVTHWMPLPGHETDAISVQADSEAA